MCNQEYLKEFCILIHKKDRYDRFGDHVEDTTVSSVSYIGENKEYLEIDIIYEVVKDDKFLTFYTLKSHVLKKHYNKFVISKRIEKILKIKQCLK